MKFYYQYGKVANTSASALFQVFLDNDLNAFNGSVAEVYRETLGSTGTNSIYPGTIQWVSNPTNTAPGTYATYARISAGGHTRYLYAPEILTLKPSLAAPTLTSLVEKNGDAQFTINGFTGQKIVLQASTNLAIWNSIATNTLPGNSWGFVDGKSRNYRHRFYRAVLAQ